MSKTRKALIIAALAALSAPVQAQTAGPLAPAEGIVIQTTGEVRVKPDLATVQAGVVSEGKTAAEALSKNTPALARLIEAVKAAGVAQGDLSTSQVALTPRMTQASASSSPQARAPKIDGYEARTGITVIVRDLAKAGPLIDALVAAGANDMSGISFGLADEDKAKDQARDKAAEAARTRAEIYAKRLGVKVGGSSRSSRRKPSHRCDRWAIHAPIAWRPAPRRFRSSRARSPSAPRCARFGGSRSNPSQSRCRNASTKSGCGGSAKGLATVTPR